jgi:type I restriction enzyme S subunit
VASISKGPNTFFRLSPVELSKASCFGLRRGSVTGRVDVNFWRLTPLFHQRFEKPSFPLVKLGDIVDLVQYGCSALASAEVRGIPMVRMNNLQNDGWDFSDLKYIELPKREFETYRLRADDILFNRTNSKELVGKCEVFREPGDWVFASYLIRVRLEPGASPQFVSDFLSTSAGRLQIDRFSRQIIGMTNINAEELRQITLPLPKDERIQREFVAAMDTARADRQRKLLEADALVAGLDGFVLNVLGLAPPPDDNRRVFGVSKQTISGGLRSDPGFHHPRYEKILAAFAACPVPKRPLGTISPEIVGGATPTAGSTDLYASEGIKFLRILNVKANEFDLSDLNHIKSEVHNGELKRSQLQDSDVLMTITGRVGNAAVVTHDLLPANINQHIVRLRIAATDVLPEYLAIYLNTSVGLALSNRGVTGGTRIALDYGTIRTLQIPVPSLPMQEEIINESRRRHDSARQLRGQAESAWQAGKDKFEEALLGK